MRCNILCMATDRRLLNIKLLRGVSNNSEHNSKKISGSSPNRENQQIAANTLRWSLKLTLFFPFPLTRTYVQAAFAHNFSRTSRSSTASSNVLSVATNSSKPNISFAFVYPGSTTHPEEYRSCPSPQAALPSSAPRPSTKGTSHAVDNEPSIPDEGWETRHQDVPACDVAHIDDLVR